jgi:hypothetical protein
VRGSDHYCLGGNTCGQLNVLANPFDKVARQCEQVDTNQRDGCLLVYQDNRARKEIVVDAL